MVYGLIEAVKACIAPPFESAEDLPSCGNWAVNLERRCARRRQLRLDSSARINSRRFLEISKPTRSCPIKPALSPFLGDSVSVTVSTGSRRQPVGPPPAGSTPAPSNIVGKGRQSLKQVLSADPRGVFFRIAEAGEAGGSEFESMGAALATRSGWCVPSSQAIATSCRRIPPAGSPPSGSSSPSSARSGRRPSSSRSGSRTSSDEGRRPLAAHGRRLDDAVALCDASQASRGLNEPQPASRFPEGSKRQGKPQSDRAGTRGRRPPHDSCRRRPRPGRPAVRRTHRRLPRRATRPPWASRSPDRRGSRPPLLAVVAPEPEPRLAIEQ
ncbi:hypothetical protein VT85_12455 [Planctomyces sp. SH-PL62]|nr:hypothetical protein VT85_12455 [Planctomyces sp. SH-PL62]